MKKSKIEKVEKKKKCREQMDIENLYEIEP